MYETLVLLLLSFVVPLFTVLWAEVLRLVLMNQPEVASIGCATHPILGTLRGNPGYKFPKSQAVPQAVLGFVPGWIAGGFLDKNAPAPMPKRARGPKGRFYRHGLSCSHLVAASERWQVGIVLGLWGGSPTPNTPVVAPAKPTKEEVIPEELSVEVEKTSRQNSRGKGYTKWCVPKEDKGGRKVARRQNKAAKMAHGRAMNNLTDGEVLLRHRDNLSREIVAGQREAIRKIETQLAGRRRITRQLEILARSQERKAKEKAVEKVQVLARWALEYARRVDAGDTRWVSPMIDCAARARILAKGMADEEVAR